MNFRSLENLTQGISDIGRALASKDLKEPANIEALVDVVLWIAVLAIVFILACRGEAGYFTLFCMAFGFTIASMIWLVIHYTILRALKKR